MCFEDQTTGIFWVFTCYVPIKSRPRTLQNSWALSVGLGGTWELSKIWGTILGVPAVRILAFGFGVPLFMALSPP